MGNHANANIESEQQPLYHLDFFKNITRVDFHQTMLAVAHDIRVYQALAINLWREWPISLSKHNHHRSIGCT